ncbi:MAG: ABC transporter permease [Aeriscardovia sp.]|nr:ABC transporter permease [Aeriscardovia sp.]MBO5633309.1 ABC transporter permease [Aeriscardovia sp.]MBR2553226.1 ABC transporter permease [Aeriscardovia sp.]
MKQVETAKQTQSSHRFSHNWIILKALVHTDFKLRYQGSFLGVIWSVLEPLMMFCVMYVVFARFLRMSDGTRTYPVVLLLGISSWQFVTDSTNVGLRSIVDRGDMLRKVHFPNYIVVVAATMGALITYAINIGVVLIFAFAYHVHFTWRVLLVIPSIAMLYFTTLGLTLIMATMYAYYRDIAHIWDVLQQVIMYGMPIVYPLTYVIHRGGIISKLARLELLNPFCEAIQEIRSNLIAPKTQPTIWTLFGPDHWWVSLIPYLIMVLLMWIGVGVFSKNSTRFAEVM